jgi:DMSO/TMAO reductase YedYZ molybdopterin-dependent catalytic subunit
MSEDVIIAYQLNDEPLQEQLRLVVPGRFGYKWISHLTMIELVNYDFKGKWESRGYSDEGLIP